MSFEWSADASHYGGVVSDYRYGWDILDLSDDSQWDIDFTPFVTERAQSPKRTFFFGTHTFYVEVIDNSGFKSRIGVRLNIVPFTMTKDLLLVDDYREGSQTCMWLTTVIKEIGARIVDNRERMLGDSLGAPPKHLPG